MGLWKALGRAKESEEEYILAHTRANCTEEAEGKLLETMKKYPVALKNWNKNNYKVAKVDE